VKAKKITAPVQGGNTKAEQLAREIVAELGDDREAMKLVRQTIRLLARRSRSSRRLN
jgi:hypothetical protein